jgi:hypothetical protein
MARLSLCQTLLHSYKSLLKVYKSHARHLSWLIGATRPTLRPLAARMPCVFDYMDIIFIASVAPL